MFAVLLAWLAAARCDCPTDQFYSGATCVCAHSNGTCVPVVRRRRRPPPAAAGRHRSRLADREARAGHGEDGRWGAAVRLLDMRQQAASLLSATIDDAVAVLS